MAAPTSCSCFVADLDAMAPAEESAFIVVVAAVVVVVVVGCVSAAAISVAVAGDGGLMSGDIRVRRLGTGIAAGDAAAPVRLRGCHILFCYVGVGRQTFVFCYCCVQGKKIYSEFLGSGSIAEKILVPPSWTLSTK